MSKTLLKTWRVSEDGMPQVATEIALNYLKIGRLVGLSGELGAGKTTLVRSISKAFGYDNQVSSPTFNLHNNYKTVACDINHWDIYRLTKTPEELFENIQNSITLVEWPERDLELMNRIDLHIILRFVTLDGGNDVREIEIWQLS